jgi:hypothetical protein
MKAENEELKKHKPRPYGDDFTLALQPTIWKHIDTLSI